MNTQEKIRLKFRDLFHEEPLLIFAPGRVNLIGEHTDYNEGFVMPAAIDKGIWFAVAPSTKPQSVIYSGRYGESISIDHTSLEKVNKPLWANYLLGVLHRLNSCGYHTGSFNCVFDGNLPDGAGLSSSAAMECGFIAAVNELFALNVPVREMVEIAQWAEHHYVGVKCGIMDQFASMMGKANHVIMLDCRTLEHRHDPLELEGYTILLLDSSVKHSLASSEYNDRRAACEQGVAIIREKFPDTGSLRDVTIDQLKTCKTILPDPIFERCLYVVQENQRVLQASEHLRNGDIQSFGEKMYVSHHGLSEQYEVSCKELDFLVDFTKPYPEIAGARMMGGGFGGCTINLVQQQIIPEFVPAITEAYQKAFGQQLKHYIVNTSNGASVERQFENAG